MVLGMVGAGGGVVVDTGEGGVEPKNVLIVLSHWKSEEPLMNSPEVKTMETCAEQQTVARNPLPASEPRNPVASELNLTSMEVPVLVKGPGMEGPRLSPSPL